MTKPATIDAYVAGLPGPLREIAEKVRPVIDATLPGTAVSSVLHAAPTWSIGPRRRRSGLLPQGVHRVRHIGLLARPGDRRPVGEAPARCPRDGPGQAELDRPGRRGARRGLAGPGLEHRGRAPPPHLIRRRSGSCSATALGRPFPEPASSWFRRDPTGRPRAEPRDQPHGRGRAPAAGRPAGRPGRRPESDTPRTARRSTGAVPVHARPHTTGLPRRTVVARHRAGPASWREPAPAAISRPSGTVIAATMPKVGGMKGVRRYTTMARTTAAGKSRGSLRPDSTILARRMPRTKSSMPNSWLLAPGSWLRTPRVCTYDRRGCGDSTDARAYAMARRPRSSHRSWSSSAVPAV